MNNLKSNSGKGLGSQSRKNPYNDHNRYIFVLTIGDELIVVKMVITKINVNPLLRTEREAKGMLNPSEAPGD